MAHPDARFTGSVPEYYDRYLVPFLFERYADDLVSRVSALDGSRVLELACGTGILTGRLRESLPVSSTLTATDLNEAMIAYARRKLGEPREIEWAVADAAALAFADRSFDTVVCQFGFMFVPDKAAAFAEARRVLTPGGTLLTNVWCSMTENQYPQVIDETLERLFPDDPPRFIRVPYSFHDTPTIEQLARDAGFSDVAIERVAISGLAESAESVAIGFARGSPLNPALTDRGADVDAVMAALTESLAAAGGARPFVAPLAALVVTAR
jgi:ubiquinone/menaquinone biosynthesis C-methylase UbiE